MLLLAPAPHPFARISAAGAPTTCQIELYSDIFTVNGTPQEFLARAQRDRGGRPRPLPPGWAVGDQYAPGRSRARRLAHVALSARRQQAGPRRRDRRAADGRREDRPRQRVRLDGAGRAMGAWAPPRARGPSRSHGAPARTALGDRPPRGAPDARSRQSRIRRGRGGARGAAADVVDARLSEHPDGHRRTGRAARRDAAHTGRELPHATSRPRRRPRSRDERARRRSPGRRCALRAPDPALDRRPHPGARTPTRESTRGERS